MPTLMNVSRKEKKVLNRRKRGKKQIDNKQPSIETSKKAISMKYVMEGICASLKNRQQIVPGSVSIKKKVERLEKEIIDLEHMEVTKQGRLQNIRFERNELMKKLAAGEERVLKNWLIQCERYKRWLQKVSPPMRIWMDQMIDKHKISFPVAHIKLKILFYFPNLNRRDGPNKEQAIFDMLQAIGLVPDDCWTVIDECHWIAKLNRPRPRTEIYITIKHPHVSLWRKYQVEPTRKKKIPVKDQVKADDMLV
jgi:hypothetical protein